MTKLGMIARVEELCDSRGQPVSHAHVQRWAGPHSVPENFGPPTSRAQYQKQLPNFAQWSNYTWV